MGGGDRLKSQAEAFEEIISEAKPKTVSSGAKRKAIILIEEVADKPSLSSTSAPVKNVMEWNCELCQKLEEESSATNDNDPPSLLTDDSANDLGKNAADEKQDNKEFTFWCDTCQIGTLSKIVMESHKIGKKHKRKTKTAALDKNC
ncbi:hypothetical protein H5410_051883 [Solanum commersonii]|uniref:C2H2-type domain-containing protein n=1 Tax=Solanum commersonii TaxID=4109 RepID=A0A9J5X2D2_SOLCO|nr:hypothetical protein H5410_051883 [Solanum commersonii]